LLLLSIETTPQEINFRFKHLGVNDGLSQIAALSILKDKYGFMWFGTQDGLNRYDGYNFKTFTREDGNKNSLSNNYLWAIHEDEEGVLWLGSFGGGLTRFDPTFESFVHYKNIEDDSTSIPSNDIFGIEEFPSGTLWMRTGNGVCKFNKRTGKATTYFTSKSAKQKNANYIGALEIQQPDFIWAGLDSTLIRININTNEIKNFLYDPISNELRFGFISKLLYDNEKLLVCCDSGLIEINFKQSTSTKLLRPPTINNRRATFNQLVVDGDYIWIGTTNGLILLDNRTKSYRQYIHNPDKPNSISNNNIVSLYKSADGILWIGTYGGINKIERLKEDFFLIQYDPSEKNTLSQKSVGPVIEDRNGLVWIGTPDGLNCYNKKSGEIITYKNIPGNNNSISSSYILSLYEDKKGQIWVGTRGGWLNKFSYVSVSDLRNISFQRIKIDNPQLRTSRVQSILEDKDGIMWFGTSGFGLIKYFPETEKLIQYPVSRDGKGPSHPFIYCLFEDSKENLWMGTPTGGLNILHKEKEEFLYIKRDEESLNSLSNDIVLSVFEDNKNKLWIGTSAGLNQLQTNLVEDMFDKIKDSSITISFERFGRTQGLPNEVIYGILQDDKNYLWFGTNNGLVKFNPSAEIPVVKVFDVNDGLQNNEFNQNSFFKNTKGEMYFGGIGGLNIFNPDSIKLNKGSTLVRFTDFKLFNSSVPLQSQTDEKIFTLPKSIHDLPDIELAYNQDVLTFEFAGLNFISSEKNIYAYMLEGFDLDWVQAGSRRDVTYTNLDPGKYVFRVKAANSDGLWNEEETSLILNISPPPWLSWYAYLFYAGLFITFLFVYVRIRIKMATRELETQSKIEKARIEEREEVRKKSSADFHDEAGNKLTKISLFTELAKSEANEYPSLKEYLNKIEENTKELSSGMRDFIWVLDPAKDSLFDTISRLKDFGSSMFDYTDIRYNVIGLNDDMKKIVLSMECRRAILLIFKEAMNNCVKHSCAKSVELNIELSNSVILIVLNDNGKGFDAGSNSNGYGLNNMRERAKKNNCEIEIISVVNKGTSIKLKMNIPQMSN
jgi:ligand-binding sensor domain-containing protein/signal transduction histidine kinase